MERTKLVGYWNENMIRDVTKIRNYTTSISASRTIMEIEELLAGVGASMIVKEFRGDGRVEALSFKYQNRGYRLPSNTEKCMEILFPQHRHRQQEEEQAERVTWRIIKDWLDAQISLIRVGQADIEQVMLPYMWNGKSTFYELVKESNFMLPHQEESKVEQK